MYFLLGSYRLGYHLNATIIGSQALTPYYDFQIRFYDKSGGIKKSYFYGMTDCPINTITFEENKRY